MFAVTGATGKLGRLVVHELAKRVSPQQIVAAVRNPDKAHDLAALGVHVRHADYDQPHSLALAFKNVDKLLLISGNKPGRRSLQHVAVIEAAKQANVSLLAYTSILRAESSELLIAIEHRETERAIRRSGLPFSFLRNGWYMENYIELLTSPPADGKILGSAQQGRIAAAIRAEYAEAAALVLTGTSTPREVYELAGDTSFTLPELAATFASLMGRSIRYQDLEPGALREALICDVSALELEFLVDTNINISRGALYDDTHTLSELLGRPTTSLAAVLRSMRKQMASH
jgi:NAD(P)H dehydrogenase (quinone)